MKTICMLTQSWYDFDARVRRKAEALISAGYSVDVLSLTGRDGKKTYTLNGVNVYTLSLGKKRGSLVRYAFEYATFFVWSLLRLSLMMWRNRYVVIDVNTLPDFLIFAALPARWMGAKIILDKHAITPEVYMSKYGLAADSWSIGMIRYLEKASFNCADYVITISEPIRDLLIARGLRPSKTIVVMNAADEARFRSSMSPAVGERSTEAFVMMYHGTLIRLYGLDIAVEAFSLAQGQMPGGERGIVGLGGEEALAYFEPNNPKDLAKQMIRLYHDRGWRARLAARAKEEYAPIRWEVMKQRYLKLIERATGLTELKPEPSRAAETTAVEG